MNLNVFAGKSSRQCLRWLTLALVLAGLAAASEKFGNMMVKDFAVPENFGPPHETQVKSLLQGAEAELQSGLNRALLHGAQWQTFTETGTTQLVVRTPQCYYDYVRKTVYSDGHLEAQGGEDQLFLEGEGFLLQLTNSTLTISNHVHTVIKNSRPPASKS